MMAEAGQPWSTPQPVIDRYYQKSYFIDIKSVPGQDQCVLQHSNKVCVVCITPSHALCTSEPVRIDFNVNEKTDRSQSKVRGKRKRGGHWLTAYSPLCKVYCKDDSQYTLYSCVRGDLLEVNENLIENPGLLKSYPLSNGYIAVVMPRFHEKASVVGDLLTEEQYTTALDQRQLAAAAAVSRSPSTCTGDGDQGAEAAIDCDGRSVADAGASATAPPNGAGDAESGAEAAPAEDGAGESTDSQMEQTT